MWLVVISHLILGLVRTLKIWQRSSNLIKHPRHSSWHEQRDLKATPEQMEEIQRGLYLLLIPLGFDPVIMHVKTYKGWSHLSEATWMSNKFEHLMQIEWSWTGFDLDRKLSKNDLGFLKNIFDFGEFVYRIWCRGAEGDFSQKSNFSSLQRPKIFSLQRLSSSCCRVAKF